jgi:hypothetical protein
MAFERRLIADEKGWGDMRKFRKKTSHTYDQNVAVEVAAFARQESVPLFDTLARTLKERTDR